ncbi:MAG: 50S ribosomal protein L11 methyltransferase [Dysgonamonadaceae bacterium]|jgi:ribosomal protein L11 methyltransferase|nr:50S ribosomal protein L11 methyltransferase [Dysgonamonadaceae bacterium]
MDYYELRFSLHPDTEIHRQILSAMLADIGFESFMDSDAGLDAYIPENLYSEAAIAGVLADMPWGDDTKVQYQTEKIAGRDWNEEWEKHFFEPIVIDNQVVIHSSFHQNVPPARYDIVIDPKMAFGTGHHATTALMVSYLAALDLDGKSFLDMGCGTSVLDILARMKNANPVTAIDIDEWSYRNSLENIRLNHTPDIRVRLGDAGLLGSEVYDVIFANINRNILLRDIPVYARCMRAGSSLFMSGFYAEDREIIRETCGREHLQAVSFKEKDHWVAVHYRKE